MNARAIFFDADGVLYYRPERDRHLEAFLEARGVATDIQAARASTARLHDFAMRGKIKLSEYEKAPLKACGVNQPDLIEPGLEAIRLDHGNIRLYEGVLDAIKTLKARKVKLGIITDSAVTKMCKLMWLKSQGLDIAWDAYANSMEFGTRKPDPLQYRAALQQAQITRLDTAFVGHAPHELQGARQVGLTTVAFNPEPGAQADYFINRFADLLDLLIWQSA
jgi:FMN phosphatase YigB (HAD superfamily)